MAIDKNGLAHRPFGSWAENEDELERVAEEERAKIEAKSQKRNAP